MFRIEIGNTYEKWEDFYSYCLERNTEKLDTLALFVKIAREFRGNYYYVDELDYDVIDFETSEDLLRFKLQFSPRNIP